MSDSIFARFNAHIAGPAMAGVIAITQMGPAYAQDMVHEVSAETADTGNGQSDIPAASAFLVMNEANKRMDYDLAYEAARVLLADGRVTQDIAGTISAIGIYANAWDEVAILGEIYPELFQDDMLVDFAQFTTAVRDGDIDTAIELIETGSYSPFKKDFNAYFEHYKMQGADIDTAFENARVSMPLLTLQSLMNGYHSDRAPEYIMNVLAAIEANPDYILKDLALGLIDGYYANADELGFENNAADAIAHLKDAVIHLGAQYENGNIDAESYGNYMRIVLSTSYNLVAVAPEMVLELTEFVGAQSSFQVGRRYHDLRLNAAVEINDYDIMADASKALRTPNGGQYKIDDWRVLYVRAEALLNQGRAQHASEEIETFLNIYAPMFEDEAFKEAHAGAYFYLNVEAAYMQLQLDMPNLDKAEYFLEQAESIDVNAPILHELHGQVALARGDAAAAITFYQYAMGLTTSESVRASYGYDQDTVALDPAANENLGDAFALSGNDSSAIFYWQRALNMDSLEEAVGFDVEDVRDKIECVRSNGNAQSCLAHP